MMHRHVDQIEITAALGRWVRHAGRDPRDPVEAIKFTGCAPQEFAGRRLLVGPSDPELVHTLVERYGARVLDPQPIPEPPPGMGPADGVDVEGFPLPTELELEDPPEPSDRARALLAERTDAPVQ